MRREAGESHRRRLFERQRFSAAAPAVLRDRAMPGTFCLRQSTRRAGTFASADRFLIKRSMFSNMVALPTSMSRRSSNRREVMNCPINVNRRCGSPLLASCLPSSARSSCSACSISRDNRPARRGDAARGAGGLRVNAPAASRSHTDRSGRRSCSPAASPRLASGRRRGIGRRRCRRCRGTGSG